jgi:hypothetical protein
MDHMSDLLDAVEAAQQNIQRLADPVELQNVAGQLVEFARSSGARSVMAASPAAERLVGALLSSGDEFVGVTRCLSAADPVLLVDVNLASGTSLAQAARLVRESGAVRVLAIVLHQLTAATAGAADCGVDVLNVLDSRPSRPIAGTTGSGLL